MAEFKAFTFGVEVNGETVLSIINGMESRREEALDILKKNGISDPRPGEWYPQQAWLDAFREIAERFGDGCLYEIGKKIPENAKFPPHIDSLEKALLSIDAAYHVNHRGGGIGSYKFEKTGGHSGVMVCKNPYPCSFDRGIIEALVRAFSPEASVRHDAGAPCRQHGADSCTYIIEW